MDLTITDLELDEQCEMDKSFYNFCRKHRGKGETPAMRQRIMDNVWSVGP
jgi:hypothetical protein